MHKLTSAGLSVPLCSYVIAHWNSEAQADQRWLICAFVFICHGSWDSDARADQRWPICAFVFMCHGSLGQ